MTSSERAQLAMVTGSAIVVTVLLGALLSWPGWLWILPGTALAGVLVMARNMVAERVVREQELYGRLAAMQRLAEPPPPVEQPVQHFEQVPLPETALPSATSDYQFLLSAVVWWRPGPEASAAPRSNLAAKAVTALLDRTLPILARERPEDWPLAQHRLAADLGEFRTDPAGVVEVSAAEVRLTLSSRDRERLASFADTRKDTEAWQYERSHVEDKRRYYHENVFQDAGSAVVWWLIKQGDNVRQTVDDMESLARLVDAAKNEGALSPFTSNGNGDHLGSAGVLGATEKLMDLMGLTPVGDERILFAQRLFDAMRAARRLDEADQLRAAYDLMAPENGDDDTAVAEVTTIPRPESPWPVEDEG